MRPRKRLQGGDIILTANYRPVRSLDDLESIIRTAESEDREAVLLRVQRRGHGRRPMWRCGCASQSARRRRQQGGSSDGESRPLLLA